MVSVISGAQTIAKVREHQSDTLLAFSCGKDAITAWLAIRPHFDRVVPYYLYLVPGLEFVEESLDYYERWFGTKIYRLPHVSFARLLNECVFQPPERRAVITEAELYEPSYEDLRGEVARAAGVDAATMVADGVRAADSPMRRLAITKHGPITWRQHKYHPVWDMRKADLQAMFRREKVRLPIDYKLFGRTFDSLDLRFLLPVKKHFPRDYRKILEWFPLAELEVFRWEHARC